MKHWMFIVLVGLLWMSVGIFLFIKGAIFIKCANLSFIKATLLSFLAFSIGLLKGHFLLRKVVKRIVDRILNLPMPISIFKVYDKKFYILIFLMVMFGAVLNYLSPPFIIRGTLDLAIGVALIKGATNCFILGFSFQKISYDS